MWKLLTCIFQSSLLKIRTQLRADSYLPSEAGDCTERVQKYLMCYVADYFSLSVWSKK